MATSASDLPSCCFTRGHHVQCPAQGRAGTYTVGQRVRTLVDAPAAWPGALAVPAGTEGTVTGLPVPPGAAYGVTVDGDPDALPLDYEPGEITAAD
jgi:hypothetical protein